MVQFKRELVRVPLGLLGGVDFERSFSWKLGITLLSGKKLVVITCVGVVHLVVPISCRMEMGSLSAWLEFLTLSRLLNFKPFQLQ